MPPVVTILMDTKLTGNGGIRPSNNGGTGGGGGGHLPKKSLERPMLRKVLLTNKAVIDQDDVMEDRILTYVNSLKMAAGSHNKTKQEAEIYTDWANHYLEKARFKRYIQDLQADISDGVLLADVIEAVANEKVHSINRKPKSSSQMIENINTCLGFLAGLGVVVDGLVAKDIRDGNLKAILGLFFSLSRYKQQQKQLASATQSSLTASSAQERNQPTGGAGGDMLSRLPSPFRQSGRQGKEPNGSVGSGVGVGGGGVNCSIPTPASAIPQKQQQQQERASRVPSYGSGNPGSKVPSASSSRSGSPSTGHSLIPQPASAAAAVGNKTSSTRPHTDKHTSRAVGSSSSNNRGVTLRNPGPPVAQGNGHKHNAINAINSNSNSNSNANNANAGSKNSMLDKFRFFNNKDKGDRSSKGVISKRTSSSSGFSSARSERSDSSNSLSSEPPPSLSSATTNATEYLSSSTNATSPCGDQSRATSAPTSGSNSPRLAVRNFARKTFGRAISNGKDAKGSSSVGSTGTSQSPKQSRSSKPSSKGKDVGQLSAAASNPSKGETNVNAKTTGIPNGSVSGSLKENGSVGTGNRIIQRASGDYTSVLESDNSIRQSSKVSLIPKGSSDKLTRTNNAVINNNHHNNSKRPDSGDSGGSILSSSASSNQLANMSFSASSNLATQGPGGTSIPKPTAAVKGTTKVSKEDRRSIGGSSLNLNQNVTQPSANNSGLSSRDSAKSAVQSNQTQVTSSSKQNNASKSALNQKHGSNKSDASTSTDLPRVALNGLSLPRSGKLDSKSDHRGVAMVSPMQSQGRENVVNSQDSSDQRNETNLLQDNNPLYPHLKSGYCKVDIGSVRTSPRLVSSTPPGTLTHSKMETTFDSSDKVITRETTTTSVGAGKETTFSEEPEADLVVNVKPMQPLLRNSPYSYVLRGLGGSGPGSIGLREMYPSNRGNATTTVLTGIHGTGGSNRLGLGLVGLGRSLHHNDPMRLYAGLSRRNVGGIGSAAVSDMGDYASDVESVDLSAGYMSDGDVLRGGRGDDIASGYLSEGGASLYSRRVHARLRDGMAAVKECMQKSPAFVQDDSFDDSSSVSSGISDTIAEISTDDNLTGSSVSSEPVNPYNSLKRAPVQPSRTVLDPSQASAATRTHNSPGSHGGGGSGGGGGGGSSSGGGDRSRRGNEASRPTGSSKSSNVKKSDSGMQTDSSAFRQVSSSAWKRYMQDKDGCEGNFGTGQPSASGGNNRQDLLRRGKSDLDPSRTRSDKRGPAGGPGIGVNSVPGGSGGMFRRGGSSGGASAQGSAMSGDKRTGKHRSSSENISAGLCMEGNKRISPRSSRSGSLEPQFPSSGSRTGGEKKVQNVRAMTSTPSIHQPGHGLAGINGNGSKRPMSSCSVASSGGSSIRSGSSSSRNTADRFHDQLSSSAPSGEANVMRPAAMQGQSRPACSGNTLERKAKMYANTHSSPSSLDLPSDGEYGKGVGGATSSLGRRGKQYTLTSPTALRDRIFGSRSTLNQSPTPMSQDYSAATIISNPHAAALGLVGSSNTHPRRSSPSPRLSVPSKSLIGEDPFNLDHIGVSCDSVSGSIGSGTGNYSWLRHSPSNMSSLATRTTTTSHTGGSLTEAESLESLASSASAALQAARAGVGVGGSGGLTHARLLMHQRETSPSPTQQTSQKLARSNSIRSTKSEKLYPSMLQRSGELDLALLSLSAHHSAINAAASHGAPSVVSAGGVLCGPSSGSGHKEHHQRHHHHASQPTSPTHNNQSIRGFPTYQISGSSPGSAVGSLSPFVGGLLSKISNKDDDLHGSAISLVSTTSSLYSTPEEKQAQEIRKLRRELADAHDKVHTLTSQLSTNKLWHLRATQGHSKNARDNNFAPIQAQEIQAHVVAAFEQSLSNMTNRLQALTHCAEQKDSELNELRSTIELLRKRSAEAGLTSANFQTSLQEHRMSRQLSTDSMSSINSVSSACSVASQTSGASQKSTDTNSSSNKQKKKKKGWLRSSFSKAFSRSKKNKNGSVSDVEDLRQLQSDTSAPNSPLLSGVPHQLNGQGLKVSHSSSAIYDKEDETAPEVVKELKKQLREKDMVLTDIRLEALSSAHQLESLKETVNKMRSEMMNLKQDNERLQRLVSSKSQASSQSSLPMLDSLDRRLSASELSAPSSIDALLADAASDKDGKRVTISVFLGCHGDYEKYVKPQEGQKIPEVMVGSLSVSGKTKWDLLDSLVKRMFKEYVLRVDPVSNLGLNAESVYSYHIGDIVRSKDSELPEFLPCGYLVGDNMQIRITLKGTKQNTIDALAFESLIPKSIVQRYISLLTEHRRIILCGPTGTGKTHLAHRLSEFLVLRSGKDPTPGSIATFSVDHKSAKELRQYLANVAEQCETNAADLPSVIILDNLHHVGSLGEVFNGFLNAKYQKCPYIIGTMNQATCSTTNLQLHHNFRWVLCANHMEPVKGFLGRYLRRKLVEHEVRTGVRNNDLTKIVDWMPKVWLQLNKFLEMHSSSDVTIGPRLFLSCPNDISGSQVWFTDLWNYSIVPYLLEAIREGLQLYGRRAQWEDPAEWVLETYPWPSIINGQSHNGGIEWPSLLRLRPEDVGYDCHPGGVGANATGSKSASHAAASDAETDPLLNMLMRLQEAASYSSPHSNDCDSTSLESGSMQTVHENQESNI